MRSLERIFNLMAALSAFIACSFTLVLGQRAGSTLGQKVVIAINAGGRAHRDVHGIAYAEDPLTVGVASDFGRRFDIQRVDGEDAILYQTERYATEDSFQYEIPIKQDGNYILVIKFAEVYFRAPHEKVFDVSLNGQPILTDLDIFAEVGPVTAHDEYIPFSVTNKKVIHIHGQESVIRGGIVPLRFHRGQADNPKVNAFFVIKGSITDVPQLPPLIPPPDSEEDELFEDEDEEEVNLHGLEAGFDQDRKTFTTGTNKWVRSGPPHTDPWDSRSIEDKFLPVGAAVVASVVAIGFVSSVIKLF